VAHTYVYIKYYGLNMNTSRLADCSSFMIRQEDGPQRGVLIG